MLKQPFSFMVTECPAPMSAHRQMKGDHRVAGAAQSIAAQAPVLPSWARVCVLWGSFLPVREDQKRGNILFLKQPYFQ